MELCLVGAIKPRIAASAGETRQGSAGGTIEAKIYITNRDVGFVKPGMNAQIRVDTFIPIWIIKGSLKSIGSKGKTRRIRC